MFCLNLWKPQWQTFLLRWNIFLIFQGEVVNYSQSLAPFLFLQHNLLKCAQPWSEFWCWTAGPRRCLHMEEWAGGRERLTVDGTQGTRNPVRSFSHHHFIHSFIEKISLKDLLMQKEGKEVVSCSERQTGSGGWLPPFPSSRLLLTRSVFPWQVTLPLRLVFPLYKEREL